MRAVEEGVIYEIRCPYCKYQYPPRDTDTTKRRCPKCHRRFTTMGYRPKPQIEELHDFLDVAVEEVTWHEIAGNDDYPAFCKWAYKNKVNPLDVEAYYKWQEKY